MNARKFCFERLEPLRLLSSGLKSGDWRSLVFNDGVAGTLGFEFSREVASVNCHGEEVGANAPRFAQPQLVSEMGTSWEIANQDFCTEYSKIAGSGWDHDGTTPLAVVIDPWNRQLFFLRGNDLTIAHVVTYSQGEDRVDLLQGTVPGYRYIPVHAIVHEGLVVFFTRRDRFDDDRYITEGVTFIYTQDLGQSFHRVAQAGGGWDVPAIAGGVSDGMNRGQRWCFSNAFPESSPDDRLGAWFPWTDYIYRDIQNPRGGQVGLFRARRAAVGEPWIVEPNVIVQERWELADSGGFHAHSAGMFADGLVSFWGDVEYRNHMERHIASDLENYTTASWIHVTEFNGAWSPNDAKVYRIGNQGASTAPGPELGQVLVTGDEQPELIMLVEAPENPSDPAIITNLCGAVQGIHEGWRYAGRVSIWIHYLPGRGYVVQEHSSHTGSFAYYYSSDGIAWSSIVGKNSVPFLYGNQILAISSGSIHAAPIPNEFATMSPLAVHPGGTNLTCSEWIVARAPGSDNSWRSVVHQDGQYVYADTLEPLVHQPVSSPPVVEGTLFWEVTTGTSSKDLGIWQISSMESDPTARHWMTTWFYPLTGNGIDPGISVLSTSVPYISSRWVANNQWVPNFVCDIPNTNATAPKIIKPSFFTGVYNPVPNSWLMAVEGLSQSCSPIYPLAPGMSGPDELVTINHFETSDEWTIGLMFGLPDISAFTSVYDFACCGTYHPLATLIESETDYIQIGLTTDPSKTMILSVDVIQDGCLTTQCVFPSVYFDVLDIGRIMISNTLNELGVTVLFPRGGYGVTSQSVPLDAPLHPLEICFSNPSQNSVTPTEWYAVQVHEGDALSAPDREKMIASDLMFSQLDLTKMGADFDHDADVDRDDLLILLGHFGSTNGTQGMGDADEDNDVDGNDFLIWQQQFEMPANQKRFINDQGPKTFFWLKNGLSLYAFPTSP